MNNFYTILKSCLKINSVEYSLLVDNNINFGTSNVVTGIFKIKNRRHRPKNSIMQLSWRAILAKKKSILYRKLGILSCSIKILNEWNN